MTAMDWVRIEEQLQAIRALVEQAIPGQMRRELYPLAEAAELLGVGKTKLRELIASRAVATVELGGRPMVPASEVRRLSQPRPSKAQSPAVKRTAADLAKIATEIPGARAPALRVRSILNPSPLAVSLAEAAGMLSCSPRHLARLIKAGALRVSMVGGLRRIATSEVLELLEAPRLLSDLKPARLAPRKQKAASSTEAARMRLELAARPR